jgi:hypothetical protein
MIRAVGASAQDSFPLPIIYCFIPRHSPWTKAGTLWREDLDERESGS